VERRINDAEAVIVREIFQRCADGQGVKAIAKGLNARGALTQQPNGTGKSHGWALSSVRGVLYRRTYLGEIRYGMTKKRDAWGQRRTSKRPCSEVLVVSQPAWRIVSDDLWRAAHARLDSAQRSYLRSTSGQLWGRPATGLKSRYLLSGLTRCALCGGSLIGHAKTNTKGKSTRRWSYYTCSSYSNRGPSVCGNCLPVAHGRGE